MAWVYLFLAIAFEVAGTTAMKLSDGFSRPLPTAVTAVAYALCFTLFARAMRTIDLGVAYAVWSGVGVAALAVIGVVWFREPAGVVKITSLGLIVAGVVGLNLAGGRP